MGVEKAGGKEGIGMGHKAQSAGEIMRNLQSRLRSSLASKCVGSWEAGLHPSAKWFFAVNDLFNSTRQPCLQDAASRIHRKDLPE